MNTMQINDLFDYDYKIAQNDNYFKFSIDSVLLAEFICVKKKTKKVLDLCSGNIPIPLILNYKFGNNIDITAVEIQKEIYDLAFKSLELNNIKNIRLINEDAKDLPNIFVKEKFDIISFNPPYFKINNTNLINNQEIKAIARHELKITLEELIEVSSKLINNEGYLYLVHRPERMADVIHYLKKYNFGLKRIVPVYSNLKEKATIILFEAIYNGKDYVIIDKPIDLSNLETYKNIFGE